MAAGNLRSGGLYNLAALASPDDPPRGSWILLSKIRNWKTLRRTTWTTLAIAANNNAKIRILNKGGSRPVKIRILNKGGSRPVVSLARGTRPTASKLNVEANDLPENTPRFNLAFLMLMMTIYMKVAVIAIRCPVTAPPSSLPPKKLIRYATAMIGTKR
jgi:hypothetical protein